MNKFYKILSIVILVIAAIGFAIAISLWLLMHSAHKLPVKTELILTSWCLFFALLLIISIVLANRINKK
jgi:hypothetical protein